MTALLVSIYELAGQAEASAHEGHRGAIIDTYMQSLDASRTLTSRSTMWRWPARSSG